MRRWMSRTVGVLTAAAWLVLLLLLFALGQRISFHDVIALINDAVVFAMFGVVAASVYFACKPRRWIAMLLLLASFVMACLSAYALWSHISLCRNWSEYLYLLSFSRNDQIYLCAAAVFVTLALLWVAVCCRIEHTVART